MMRAISTTPVEKLDRYWIRVEHPDHAPGPWIPIWAGGLAEGFTLDEILGEVFGVWSMLHLESSAAKCLETLGLPPNSKLPDPGELEIRITRNRKKGKQGVGYVRLRWNPHVYTVEG